MKFYLIICFLLISCDRNATSTNFEQDSCTPSISVISRIVAYDLSNSEKPFKFTFINKLTSHQGDCSLSSSAKLDLIVENESVDTVTMAFKIEFRRFNNPSTTHFGHRLDSVDPKEARYLFNAATNFLEDLNSYEIIIAAHEIGFPNPSL